MTDSTLNRFLSYGTNAQRLVFTPSVPTPASGPSQAYVWYETDTGLEYTYASGAWHLIGSTAVGNVSGPASSTDRAVATWNSTGGVLLRDNSAVTIDASGNITTSGKATITGNVSGGNLTTAGVVSATGNVSGGNLTTAGNVTGANIGNITSTNLNGNGSTVLLGNGTFGAAPAGGGGALTLIDTKTPSGSGNNTASFTSIPGTYKNLLLIGTARSDANGPLATQNVLLTFNGDSGANYDFSYFQVVSTSVGSSSLAATTSLQGGLACAGNATASRTGYTKAMVLDYANSTSEKMVHMEGGVVPGNTTTNMISQMGVAHWRSTAAITQIDATLSGGNYTNISKFELYGLS